MNKKSFSKLLSLMGLCALTFTACENHEMKKNEAPKKQESSKDSKNNQKNNPPRKSSY
jgi:hypothetical protein